MARRRRLETPSCATKWPYLSHGETSALFIRHRCSMRRGIAVTGALFITAAMLAGCGDNESSESAPPESSETEESAPDVSEDAATPQDQAVDLGESPTPTEEGSQAAPSDASVSTGAETGADSCQELDDAAMAWIRLEEPAAAYQRVAKTAQKGIKQVENLNYRGAYRTLSRNLPDAIDALPTPMPEQSEDLLAECSDAEVKSLYLATTTDHAQDFLDAFADDFANGNGLGNGSVTQWLYEYELYRQAPVKEFRTIMKINSELMLDTFENGQGLKGIADTATTLSRTFNP